MRRQSGSRELRAPRLGLPARCARRAPTLRSKTLLSFVRDRRPTIGCFAVCGLRRLENACTSLGTSCQRTHRLASHGGIGCERRSPFNSESGARRRSRAFESPQHIGRRDRRIGRLAMSMAVGEYVSVHSQADTEQAELKRERVELRTTRARTRKLAAIYVARGLDPSLAKQVAMQPMGRACPRRIRHH